MHKTRVTKWLREDTQAGRDAALGYQLLARRHSPSPVQATRQWGGIDARVTGWKGEAATDPPAPPAVGKGQHRWAKEMRMATHPGAV